MHWFIVTLTDQCLEIIVFYTCKSAISIWMVSNFLIIIIKCFQWKWRMLFSLFTVQSTVVDDIYCIWSVGNVFLLRYYMYTKCEILVLPSFTKINSNFDQTIFHFWFIRLQFLVDLIFSEWIVKSTTRWILDILSYVKMNQNLISSKDSIVKSAMWNVIRKIFLYYSEPPQ